jgi:methylthioribulose-1-phosphate dehydratase
MGDDVRADELHGGGSDSSPFSKHVALLADAGRVFYGRKWVLGTGGNFSAVVNREPLRLLITASGAEKGSLAPEDFVQVGVSGEVLCGGGMPSAETALHLAVVSTRRAEAVFHTHSVWSTLISDEHAADGGLFIENYEMLKGLSGVTTHEHREWLPIIENTQRWPDAIPRLEAILTSRRDVHGFLVLRHGLYTWGRSIAEARRHVEILEFLLEVVGRTRCGRR